ncbi:MAG: hypothetical protein RLZZ387_1909 [Chloroflexota bacterium]|jgi:hypothetical protein
MRGKNVVIPAALVVAFMLALSCTLMGMAALPRSLSAQRIANMDRWHAQAPESYRVVVEVSFTGRTCLQEIEVRGDAKSILHDTCGSSWISTLWVPRLFELGQRLERPAECFPSNRNCVCQRVRIGSIEYDPELGFPGSIVWRRELRPNWHNPAYLARMLETRELPNCTAAQRSLRLTVISLTPLP